MNEEVRRKLDEYLAVTDREFSVIRKYVVGDKGVVARLMMCFLAVGPRMARSGREVVSGGADALIGSCVHPFLNDVPGVGKTYLAKVMADMFGGSFSRIQANSDLRPSKVLGVVRLANNDMWVVDKGPVFANIVLVDEINRADEDTQSAFLEPMGEGTVTFTIPGEEDENRRKNTKPLPQPFWLLASQNPLEQKGVKPLPEAQLDRFGMALNMTDYTVDDLKEIAKRNKDLGQSAIEPVSTIEELQARRVFIYENVIVSDAIRTYIGRLVRATHNPFTRAAIDEKKQDIKDEKDFRSNWEYVWRGTKFAEKYVLTELIKHGSSPRGNIFLENLSQAAAFLAHNRENREGLWVLPKDIKKIAVDVLAHRIWLTPTAKLFANDFGGEYIMRRLIMEHIVENVEW